MINRKVVEQLQGFITKTKEDKIDWKYLNNNAVRFTKSVDNRVFTLTVQSQGNPPRIVYILTLQLSNPNEALLQIQTQTMPDYTAIVKELFDLAMSKSTSTSAKAIDDLLDSL